MARWGCSLAVAMALAAGSSAWAHADHRQWRPAPPRASAPAAQYSVIAMPRVAPPAVAYAPAYAAPPAAIRTYAPRPVYRAATRVVAAPTPYYVVVGTGYTGNNLAYPAESNWNWSPVDSVVSLAGRGELRYYCPEARAYYPQVEICPSAWLKVIP